MMIIKSEQGEMFDILRKLQLYGLCVAVKDGFIADDYPLKVLIKHEFAVKKGEKFELHPRAIEEMEIANFTKEHVLPIQYRDHRLIDGFKDKSTVVTKSETLEDKLKQAFGFEGEE